MNIIVKHSTKKKIVTFSTIVSGFVTLIALIAKFGSGSLSNISSISEASSALDSVNSSMSFIIILCILNRIYPFSYFIRILFL